MAHCADADEAELFAGHWSSRRAASRVLFVGVPSSRDMPRQKGHKGRSSIAAAGVFAHYRLAFHTAADDGQARLQHKGQGKTSA
jgi:hypothetical protein